jgi:hypothetical protein
MIKAKKKVESKQMPLFDIHGDPDQMDLFGGSGIPAELVYIPPPSWESIGNYLPQYQGKEIDGDYSQWLIWNNMD